MRTLTLLLLAQLGCGGSEPAPVTRSAASVATPAPRAEAPKAESPEAGTPEPASAAGAVAAATAAPAGDAGDVAAGKAVYEQYCQACHQADGTALNGMLGADFVHDETRLAKSDEQLLTSIREGVTGKIGAMPPWKDTLSDAEQRNVLAYIRATFGE